MFWQMQNACHIDIDQSMPAGLPRKITISANTQEVSSPTPDDIAGTHHFSHPTPPHPFALLQAVTRGLSAIQAVMSSGSTSVLKTITGPCSQTIDCDVRHDILNLSLHTPQRRTSQTVINTWVCSHRHLWLAASSAAKARPLMICRVDLAAGFK